MRIDEALLLDAVDDVQHDVPGLLIGGSAAFAGALAARGRHTVWLPLDAREMSLADERLEIMIDAGAPLPPDAVFGAVILPAPPERDLGRRWLVLARNHLAPGGLAVLAGANATGIRSTIADGRALFGEPLREDYRSKHRVAVFVAGGRPRDLPGWMAEPGVAEGTWGEVSLEVDGSRLRLATLPGVFSGARLDAGTELLLAHLAVEPGERVLDVGCGAGTIGFVALRRGARSILMTDVNLLAVASVRETLRRDGIAAARVVAGDVYDGFDPADRFDLVVSNPPFHQGKTVDYGMPQRLIAEAGRYLAPHGRLVIVANAFLPYERLLEERFRVVQPIAATRRFKVLLARRPR